MRRTKDIGKSRGRCRENAESGGGVNSSMWTFRDAFHGAGERPSQGTSTQKKNYAERLSRNLATLFANRLRKDFDPITPDESGKDQEKPARTAKGTKKLDVNYSHPDIGLGLGVSIKTLNFRDADSGRYTKNYTRIDNELRAEALDYHERQPWAVLVGVIFLPVDACDDYSPKPRKEASSSFGQAIKVFRYRGGRSWPTDADQLFERVLVGLYAIDDDPWDVRFFDVMQAPARSGRPSKTLSLEEVLAEIVRTYDSRNNDPFVWAEE